MVSSGIINRKRRRPASSLVARLERLRKILRPTPHVPLAVEGMNLFAKLEYVNPVGSSKDRPAYWILKRAAGRSDSKVWRFSDEEARDRAHAQDHNPSD